MIKLNSKIKRFRQFPAGCAGVFFAALLGGLLLSGCSQQDADGRASGSAVLGIGTVSTALTDAGTRSTTTLTSGSIGVFRLADAGHEGAFNVEYTYSSGWTSDTPVTLGAFSSSICVYSPYGSNGIDASTNPRSVALTAGAYEASSDLCYYSGSASVRSPQVNPVLKHAYARLRINLKRGSLYGGTGAVSSVEVSGTGLESSARLDLSTGVYSEGVSGKVSFDPGITGLASGETKSLEVLLVPCSVSGKVVISLLVDGVRKVAFLDVSTLNLDAASMAGKLFEVNVQLGEDVSVAPEANCYIVAPGGSVNIPVSRANKSALSTQLADVTKGWSSEVIWRDNSSLEMSSDDAIQAYGAFTVKATDASATGNALVCIKDGSGNILWSWHIWVTNYDPESENQSYDGYTFMDRNLGAVNDTPGNPGAMGLLYQWGRKDPFAGADDIASSVLKKLYSGKTGPNTYNEAMAMGPANTEPAPTTSANNLENSVRHPGMFYFNSSSPYDWYPGNSTTQNDDLWKSTKTVYDPCPAGWKVAPEEAFSGFSTTTFVRKGTTSDDWSTYPGRFLDNETTGSWFPASGRRTSSRGALTDVGTRGYYWPSAVGGSLGSCLYFYSSSVNPVYSDDRASGFALRCVQE